MSGDVYSSQKRAKLGCLQEKRTSGNPCVLLLWIVSVSVLVQCMYPWCPISMYDSMDQS